MTKGAGFFKELSYSDGGPSILSAVGELHGADKERVLAYLAAGVPVDALLLVTCDVLDEEQTPIGALEFLSDGEWVWPSDLAYYVEMYDCTVPDEFRAHMASKRWRVPKAVDRDAVLASMQPTDDDAQEDFDV
jgi:hypothetical protein